MLRVVSSLEAASAASTTQCGVTAARRLVRRGGPDASRAAIANQALSSDETVAVAEEQVAGRLGGPGTGGVGEGVLFLVS